MFRVLGRDARGKKQEISVSASTEEEARAIAAGAGLATIDHVSVPPPYQISRFLKLSGFTLAALGSFGCLVSVVLGAVIGVIIGTPEPEPSGNILAPEVTVAIRTGQRLEAVFLGAVVGLFCGIGILAACYINNRDRS